MAIPAGGLGKVSGQEPFFREAISAWIKNFDYRLIHSVRAGESLGSCAVWGLALSRDPSKVPQLSTRCSQGSDSQMTSPHLQDINGQPSNWTALQSPGIALCSDSTGCFKTSHMNSAITCLRSRVCLFLVGTAGQS